MKNKILIVAAVFLMSISGYGAAFEKEIFRTATGEVEATFIGHASLIFTFNGKVIHIDPYSKLADYSQLPDGDVVFITHSHQDHLDKKALEFIVTTNTALYLDEKSSKILGNGTVVKNNSEFVWNGIKIEVIPAYNMVHKRDNGEFYHPKGEGNGYIFNIDGIRILVAGDTENIPEIKGLKNIDYAFLPMNTPFTMTPEMTADAAKAFKPKVLFPYHYGKTDISKFMDLMKDEKEVEVRIKKME